MRLLKLFSIALIAATLSACGKPLAPAQAAYAGQWTGPGIALAIGTDGMVDYRKVEERKNGTYSTNINAPIQEFVANGFTVGLGPITTTFVVQAAPHKDGEVWKMTVDGVELTRALPVSAPRQSGQAAS